MSEEKIHFPAGDKSEKEMACKECGSKHHKTHEHKHKGKGKAKHEALEHKKHEK